jgi:hypothetical protein
MAGLSGLHALVMLCDLALYATFAGGIAAAFGASAGRLLLGILLQSICYGLCAALKERGALRYAALLPMLLGWALSGQTTLDRVLLVPAAVYILWRAASGRYELSHERQAELLRGFCKGFWLFALLLAAIAQSAVAVGTAFLFAGLLAVVSVLALRVLRHAPDEAITPRLLAVEAAPLALLFLFVVALLAVCGGLVGLVAPLYGGFADAAAYGLGLVVYWPATLFVDGIRWLLALATSRRETNTVTQPISSTGTELSQAMQTTGAFPLGEWLLAVLLLVCVLAALVLLFRLLAKKPPREQLSAAAEAARSVPVGKSKRKSAVPNPSVYFVRRQYRRFLKACREANLTLLPADTSEEIRLRAEHDLLQRAENAATNTQEMRQAAQQLRALYIGARYNGKASRADAAEAKRLTDRLLRAMRAR